MPAELDVRRTLVTVTVAVAVAVAGTIIASLPYIDGPVANMAQKAKFDG